MKLSSRAPFGFTVIDGRKTNEAARPLPRLLGGEQMKYYWLPFSDSDRFDYGAKYLSTKGNVFAGLR